MANFIIGLDIGGTKMSGVLFDGKKVIKELAVVTPSNLESFKRNTLKLIDFLSAEHKVSNIGIAMAGLMDNQAGLAIGSPNIPYIKNFPLVSFIRERGFKHVALDNDANCFLRAELTWGQVKKYKHVFGVIIGTGIGGAMYAGNNMYRGGTNLGGEWGRWLIDGQEFEKTYHTLKHGKDNKKMQHLFSIALANMINFLRPQAIVVGGTYGQLKYKEFLPQALKLATKHIPHKKSIPKLFISNLKNAGALGATLLVSK